MSRLTIPTAEADRILHQIADAARAGICDSRQIAHLCHRRPAALRRLAVLRQAEETVRHVQ